MIRNWREDFHNPEMPFYFVQIAPYKYNKNNPSADLTPCAELWEAQLETRKTVRWYLDHPQWVQGVVSGAYRDWVKTQYGQ